MEGERPREPFLTQPWASPALRAGCAVEVTHAYTLVHDDLPCMDDDVERRGSPTCHVKFGEANALLAGDALLTLAFEILAETAVPSGNAAALVATLARAAGSRGVVGGQVEDLAAMTGEVTADDVAFVHQHKTGDLFAAAIRLGALCAGAQAEQLRHLADYSAHMGVAFQITDDLLDAPTRQPDQPDGASILDAMTLDEARTLLDTHRRAAHAALACETLKPAGVVPLAAIVEWVSRREA